MFYSTEKTPQFTLHQMLVAPYKGDETLPDNFNPSGTF